jgi:hypothetical protein
LEFGVYPAALVGGETHRASPPPVAIRSRHPSLEQRQCLANYIHFRLRANPSLERGDAVGIRLLQHQRLPPRHFNPLSGDTYT